MVRQPKYKTIHGDSGDKARKRRSRKKKSAKRPHDDFVSVARRLEANEDKATFEAKLARIAKAKPQPQPKKRKRS